VRGNIRNKDIKLVAFVGTFICNLVESVLNFNSEKREYMAERILLENKGENDIRTL
jgi:hypothetical protein